MKVCCISDLHGHLPEIPDCDLLLIGGDITIDDSQWWLYGTAFKHWIARTAQKCKIVGVAGNHDFAFQNAFHLIPEMEWTYLQDSGTTFQGLKIWGSPWQPVFGNWAFNAEEKELERRWAMIPDDTDILLLHGPPHGFGDMAPNPITLQYEHTGSPSLTKRIIEVQPKLVVAGHIHSGRGEYQIGTSKLINAAYTDESYQPVIGNHFVVEL